MAETSRPWFGTFRLSTGDGLPSSSEGSSREYGRVSRDRVDAVWERNRYIVEAVEAGRSRRSVPGRWVSPCRPSSAF